MSKAPECNRDAATGGRALLQVRARWDEWVKGALLAASRLHRSGVAVAPPAPPSVHKAPAGSHASALQPAPTDDLGVTKIMASGGWRLAAFCAAYLGFLAMGASVFSAIEGPEEQNRVAELRRHRTGFLNDHTCVSDEALERLIEEVVAAANRGVSATRNATGAPNWSFGQAVFFASTVVTTIGYGHVTPLSRAGKLFCVGYALVGVPLTLVLLSALVERLLGPTTRLLRWLGHRLGQNYRPLTVRLLHLAILATILCIIFIVAPSVVLSQLEPDWDFLDSVYYCFISLTTIGLGDYIPGDSPDQRYRPLYKLAVTVYLFAGITFMMLTLTVFYEIPQLNLGLLFTSEPKDLEGEKARLAEAEVGSQYGLCGPRTVVRVRARQQDSPSPDEVGMP